MINQETLQALQRFKNKTDTDFHRAAYDGDIDTLQECLKDKNLCTKINDRNRLGCSPLRLATSENHRDVVRFLIQSGADINLSDVKAQTPLYVAVKKHHMECISELLEAGASPDGDPKSMNTPIYLAAMDGRLDIAKILVKYGADLDQVPHSFGSYMSTPLYIAIVYRRQHIFNLLLRAGAKPEAHSSAPPGFQRHLIASQSLYHAAVKYNSDINVVQQLYDFGAALYIRDDKGRLPHELEDNECSRFLQTLFGSPRTLMSQSRISIRRAIGRHRLLLIDTLMLPAKIHRYLEHD